MTEAHAPARLQRLYAALLAPVDAAWLVAFRVLFGLAMCVSSLRFIAFGWVDAFFVKPAFHFKYWGFHWVEPLPGPAMHAVVWALAAASLLIAVGLWFRFAAWAFAIGFAYLQLIDVATYLNHYYLANLLAVLLALSPAGRFGSIDAWRSRRGPAASTTAWYWLYLFRFQIGVVYTFAGLAKAQADWLLHAQPLRIWLGSKTGLPIIGGLFTAEWAAPVLSWGGFLFDTGIVWLLLWRRTRPFAYAAVIGFHAMTSALFPIGMFPVIMVLSALVFFEPDWPRRALALLRRSPRTEAPARAVVVPPRPTLKHAVVFACTVVYCALHVALPLRHLGYPGSVLWHEQGMRWSWRVMVREKNGSVTFLVRDKRTGREWHVSPRRYLTRQQEQELSGQPDLILQLAHHVREEFGRRTGGPVEVRVDALVSLNGRRARALIDPSVDLGAMPDGVSPAEWITAAPAEPPPHIHPI